MGDFRVTVEAVGPHGCERDVGDGGTVAGCGSPSCPDCITAEYISKMSKAGTMVKNAKIQHWPETTGEVIDAFDMSVHGLTLQPRIRTGKF